jgi:putative hydrolase
MLQVDLHSHTLFSRCGLHTAMEMLNQAKAVGLKGLAITDHGLTLGGHLNGPFFNRLYDPVPGVKLFKGVECNVLDDGGHIDLPMQWIQYLDVVLVGLHPNLKGILSRRHTTDMLVAALERNPYVDIVSHPNSPDFMVDFEQVAQAALKHGIALELNNSKSRPGYATDEVTLDLIKTCKEVGCTMAVSSDAHAITEVGDDSYVRGFLEDNEFPEELIVNRSLESTLAFIEQRRQKRIETVESYPVE